MLTFTDIPKFAVNPDSAPRFFCSISDAKASTTLAGTRVASGSEYLKVGNLLKVCLVAFFWYVPAAKWSRKLFLLRGVDITRNANVRVFHLLFPGSL